MENLNFGSFEVQECTFFGFVCNGSNVATLQAKCEYASKLEHCSGNFEKPLSSIFYLDAMTGPSLGSQQNHNKISANKSYDPIALLGTLIVIKQQNWLLNKNPKQNSSNLLIKTVVCHFLQSLKL